MIPIDQTATEPLKRRLKFHDWAGTSRSSDELLAVGYESPDATVPGDKRGRRQRLEVGGTIRLSHDFWVVPHGSGEHRLRVDAYECPSRIDAHQVLVRVLGEFQSPNVTRDEELDAGDVAFVLPGGAVRLVARANLVWVIIAFDERAPTATVARALDTALTTKPTALEPRATRRSWRAQRRVAVGERILVDLANLEVDADDSGVRSRIAAARSPMLKIFADRGRLERTGAGVHFIGDAPGPATVEVYSVLGSRCIGTRQMHVDVR